VKRIAVVRDVRRCWDCPCSSDGPFCSHPDVRAPEHEGDLPPPLWCPLRRGEEIVVRLAPEVPS
jgi:hypothetical protein